AQRQHRSGDVRPPTAQRRELRIERLALLVEIAQRHLLFREPVLDLGLALLECCERALGLASVLGEAGRVTGLAQAELAGKLGVGFGAAAPLGLPLRELRDLRLEPLDAVAAVLVDRAADVVALGRERALLLLEPVRARLAALDLGVEPRDALRQ